MPKKLQSFYVLKLETNRLKTSNYKITLDLENARRNGELVRLGDSELLRAVRRIRGIEFNQEILDGLLSERLKLSRKQNNSENRKKIQDVTDAIDKILFCDDLVILKISDVRHYVKVIKNSLRINNRIFSRIICGAGHARRNSVVFCVDEIKNELSAFLYC